jgi:hypothetical protein
MQCEEFRLSEIFGERCENDHMGGTAALLNKDKHDD